MHSQTGVGDDDDEDQRKDSSLNSRPKTPLALIEVVDRKILYRTDFHSMALIISRNL